MYFSYQNINDPIIERDIVPFLAENNLDLDPNIEVFVIAYNDQDEIIACGGLSAHIIKCVAISESCRGEGVALKLATELVNTAYELGRHHLFIYTKPEYETLFHSCGFYTVATAYPNVVLLENSATGIKKYCQKLVKQRVEGDKIGAIVMNANPFTLGHYYLITQALAQCDHLHIFVVGENASQFSYKERFNLVKQGISELKNITLHQGTDYIISRATFPNYFIKDKGLTDSLYVELDLKIFRRYIAPALNINYRFVGSEPICAVTNEYNRQMHYWLAQAEMSAPKINVVEIERVQENQLPISASRVRALYGEEDWTALMDLVPKTTFNYLQMKRYGKFSWADLWLENNT